MKQEREKKNGTKEKHINKNRNRSASCVCMLYSVGKCDSGDQDGVSSDGGGCGRYGESDCICRGSVYTGRTAGSDFCIHQGEKSADSGSDDPEIRGSGVSGTDGGTVFLLLHRCCPHFRSKRRHYHRTWQLYCDTDGLPDRSKRTDDREKNGGLRAWICRCGCD